MAQLPEKQIWQNAQRQQILMLSMTLFTKWLVMRLATAKHSRDF